MGSMWVSSMGESVRVEADWGKSEQEGRKRIEFTEPLPKISAFCRADI